MNDLLTRGAAALVGVLFSAGAVASLGAAIQWARFESAGLPADQAVAAIGREELVVVGAVSLLVYLVLGAFVVLASYLADRKGSAGNATRNLLIGAVVVGTVATRLFTDVTLPGSGGLLALGALLVVLNFGVAARPAPRSQRTPASRGSTSPATTTMSTWVAPKRTRCTSSLARL